MLMLASKCSFKQMFHEALTNRTLAESTSFMQVEYGLSELEACWDGFVHTSDAYHQEFKSRKQICEEFSHALSEYIQVTEEPSFNTLGS